MARTLTKNQEHYRRALQRLPLGVASNFRFWGDPTFASGARTEPST